MSASSAWPFLVGRSRNAGHRVVVAPGYLTDSGDTAKLGLLARGETGPGEAFIAQVPYGPDGQPALAVYRVFRARRSDYFGYPGADDEPLTDREGRDIRITEGFLVNPVPADPDDLSLTMADMEAAHQQLERAYQLFWQTEDDYVLQSSHRITVGVRGQGSPLLLRPPASRSPVTKVPDSGAARPLPFDQQPAEGPSPWEERNQLPSPDPLLDDYGDRRAQKDHRLRWRVTTTAVAALFTFGVILVLYFAIFGIGPNPASSSPASTSAKASAGVSTKAARTLSATLAEICATLKAGNAAGAYALTTPAFRTAKPEPTFSEELTQGTGKAKSCKTAAASGIETASTTMTITTTGGIQHNWTVALIRSGTTWEVSRLAPDPAIPAPSKSTARS